MNNKRIAIVFPGDLWFQISQYAARNGLGMAAAIRELVEKGLDKDA